MYLGLARQPLHVSPHGLFACFPFTFIIVTGVGQAVAPFIRGGKSGLHRAECQVTPGRREPMESATENIPPVSVICGAGKGEMVR